MLITKKQPVGIDIPVQKLQTLLHTKLIPVWGITSEACKAYGRCYRNKVDGGYTAENYEGQTEYKEVYWDDDFSAISFFGVGNSIRRDATKELAAVHLIYFVNLEKIKPAIQHRADEEVHRDTINTIGPGLYGFEFKGIETGIETVLREYPGSMRDKRLIAVDMHPIHCFRLNFNLLYNINNC